MSKGWWFQRPNGYFESVVLRLSTFPSMSMFPETGVAGSTFVGIASGTSEPIRLARLDFAAGPSAGLLSISATGLASDLNQGLFLVSAGQVGFSASTQVEILAVPEPETYAMLLSGLGVLAMIARRRRHVRR